MLRANRSTRRSSGSNTQLGDSGTNRISLTRFTSTAGVSIWLLRPLNSRKRQLFVLGLFLFEEAAESVYGVGGILPLRFVAAGGRSAAEAAGLRFEEIFRQPADIRNKFRLCGRALNLERNFQTFAASTATAPSNRAEKPAEPATRSGG